MAHAENTVSINRPVEEVFDFILNGNNNPLWQEGITDIRLLQGKAPGAGAIYIQGARGPIGRRIDADYEITECESNRRIKFRVIAGPGRPTGTFEFESEAGSTMLKFTLDFHLTGLAKLMNSVIQKKIEDQVGALTKMKALLEYEAPSTQ